VGQGKGSVWAMDVKVVPEERSTRLEEEAVGVDQTGKILGGEVWT